MRANRSRQRHRFRIGDAGLAAGFSFRGRGEGGRGRATAPGPNLRALTLRLLESLLVELVLGEIKAQIAKQDKLLFRKTGLEDEIAPDVRMKGRTLEVVPRQTVITRIHALHDRSDVPVMQKPYATERAAVELRVMRVTQGEPGGVGQSLHESDGRACKGEVTLVRGVDPG